MLKEIEMIKAKERIPQAKGEKRGVKSSARETFPQEIGKARDKAADKLVSLRESRNQKLQMKGANERYKNGATAQWKERIR